MPPAVTTEHPVNEPGFAFSKSVDPVSGTAVDPGAVLTYTLTGVNTGQTALESVDIADDLSGLLEFAEYNGDAAAAINGQAAAAPTVAGDSLSWSGALEVGQTATLVMQVNVADSATGTLVNTAMVSSDADPESPAAEASGLCTAGDWRPDGWAPPPEIKDPDEEGV